MTAKKLIFLFVIVFLPQTGLAQEKQWMHALSLGIETSLYRSSVTNPVFTVPPYQVSVNYELGWNVRFRLNSTFYLEGGILFLRRKNENASSFDPCYPRMVATPCPDILIATRNKNYHLAELPLNLLVERKISQQMAFFGSVGISNYLNLFTTYKTGDISERVNDMNYYGYSFNAALGLNYLLHEKWILTMEMNARIFESYRQEEILFGNGDQFDPLWADNLNLLLGVKRLF
ncbi:MAG: outer membrane beta-barrel protein [Bacteroidota bacterium]